MDISIIILNYGDPKNTFSLVKSVSSFSSINHIIVVDNFSNASTQASLQKGLKNQNKVVLLFNSGNLGFACGNNVGLNFAWDHFHSDLLIVSNPDVDFEESLIEIARLIFENETQCAEVVFDFSSSKLHSLAQANAKRPKNYWSDYGKLMLIRGKKQARSLAPYEKTDYAIGGLMFFSGPKFVQVGFFGPETFLYCEEIIVGERLRRAGYEVIAAHNGSYSHLWGETTRHYFGFNRKLSLWFKSKRVYWKTYRGASKVDLVNIYFLEFLVRILKNIYRFPLWIHSKLGKQR